MIDEVGRREYHGTDGRRVGPVMTLLSFAYRVVFAGKAREVDIGRLPAIVYCATRSVSAVGLRCQCDLQRTARQRAPSAP